MVVDTSVLIAILRDEPERERFIVAIDADDTRLLSVVSLVEASMVIESRRGAGGGNALDLLLQRAEVELVPVDLEQAGIARVAWRTYGKGRHPAALNFGDCFSYALAKARGEPLLFKGDDFARTDIASA